MNLTCDVILVFFPQKKLGLIKDKFQTINITTATTFNTFESLKTSSSKYPSPIAPTRIYVIIKKGKNLVLYIGELLINKNKTKFVIPIIKKLTIFQFLEIIETNKPTTADSQNRIKKSGNISLISIVRYQFIMLVYPL